MSNGRNMMRDCMSVYRIPNLPRSRGRSRGLSAGIQEGMHIIASPSLPHTRAHKHMFAHAVSGSISPRLVQRPLSHSRLAELRFPAKKKGGSRWLSHRNDWLGLGPIGRVATAPYAPYRHSDSADTTGSMTRALTAAALQMRGRGKRGSAGGPRRASTRQCHVP